MLMQETWVQSLGWEDPLEKEMAGEPGRAPPPHAHGDLTSLAPHERLPEILVARAGL